MIHFTRVALFGAASLFALAACGGETETTSAAAPQTEAAGEAGVPAAGPETATETASAEAPADPIAAAINDPARPAADKESDARRHAAEALAFFQVEPGDTVLEIEAGGGWYTELLSRLVGPEGTVIMQNPEGFLAYVSEELEARFADDRLPNVRQSISIFDDFDVEDASVDVATWVQGPHELWFKPEDGTSLGDPAASFAEIYRVLKPGGVFAVIDHRAADGAPETAGHDLHRIDPAIIKGMAAQAGFALDGEADFLANPEDDFSVVVFDPSVRGKTSQFAIRFRKPE